jgi:transposase-like protein
VSSFLDSIKEKVAQSHPLWLTSPLSSIIADVIQNGWGTAMTQHFLLSSAARTLSGAKVARMTDDEAREAFRLIRWSATNGEPFCPSCGCFAICSYNKFRPIFKCKNCEYQFSVTSGTIFASHKRPIRDYLLATALSKCICYIIPRFRVIDVSVAGVGRDGLIQ